MRIEAAGVWLDRSSSNSELWVVAKLPMNVIRAIKSGAAVSLRSWVVDIDGKHVTAFGFQVDDNPQQPCLIYGACRTAEQVQNLRSLMAAATFPLQVHNEIFLPVLYASCVIDPQLARPAIDVTVPNEWPDPEGKQIRARALDVIQASVDWDVLPNAILAHCKQPLTFERMQHVSWYIPSGGTVRLEDQDQGNELERLAFEAFEYLCPFGAYHQPQVKVGGKLRELCDILAVSRRRESDEEGLFIVQSKVASEWAEGLARTTSRRAASIHKSILAAINQLKGAIRQLRAGNFVFRADGTPIEVDPPLPELKTLLEPLNLRERANKVGHGIALVSDMNEDVDWKDVARELIAASAASKYFFHVLDLRELQRLVTYSGGRPALFEGHLVRRWELVVQSGSALVRSSFLHESKPPKPFV